MVILHEPAHPRLNLKNTKLKHSVRTIFHEEKETHAKPHLKEIYALNVYQINILKILTFIQKVKNTTIPRVFLSTFGEIEYRYPTHSQHIISSILQHL